MKRTHAKAAMAATVVALSVSAFGTAALAQTTTPLAGQVRTLDQPAGIPQPGAARGLADPSSSIAGKVWTLGEASTADSFAQQAAASGIFEVESGRLAMDRANLDSVRAFGRQMVQDHTLGNQQLMTLARTYGSNPEPVLTGQQQQMLTQLQGLSGRDFDRQYLSDQIVAHQETIRLYEAARTSTDSGMQPYREFAAQSLPMLEQHLQHAQALAGSGIPTARMNQ
jgi:Predicted outer membrane protein